MEEKGRILIFTGDGKGKTTAALGMALRAHGYGIPISVIQLVKEDTATGEYAVLTRLSDVTITVAGRGFVPLQTDPAWQEHRRAAEEGFRVAREAVRSGRYGLVIIDEGCYAVARGLLPEEEVLQLLAEVPPAVTVVLTGRGATPRLIAAADTVSEVLCVKHGFNSGRQAQKGVEF